MRKCVIIKAFGRKTQECVQQKTGVHNNSEKKATAQNTANRRRENDCNPKTRKMQRTKDEKKTAIQRQGNTENEIEKRQQSNSEKMKALLQNEKMTVNQRREKLQRTKDEK